MVIAGLVLLTTSRLGLMWWWQDRVASTEQTLNIIIQGMRADLIVLCLLAAIPVLLALPLATARGQRLWFPFTRYWSIAALTTLVFIELATPAFMLEYDVRPNRIFIEYLKYPREVLSTLWQGFRFQVLAGVILTTVFAWLAHRIWNTWLPKPALWPLRKHLLIWPVIVLLVVAGVRSTTAHRPANPAMFAITSDSMVNSLVISSLYSVLYELYNLRHEANSSDIYGKIDTAAMISQTRQWPWLQTYQYPDHNYPTLHWQSAVAARERPLNIVIVLQESMGATFVESLGGMPTTPELEKLRDRGIWFDNLYATGTRSVRGIEAVVSGFMPTPALSTVKLSGSQQGFTTLASILAQQGYHTQFIYGGEAHFDNMRSFFTGNGFKQIVDLPQFENPVMVGSWGASDEDLFNNAHRELSRLHQSGQPFFSLIFTTSNHQPFEFPEHRIELFEQPANTAANAVKYADWAMGRFFETAMASPYWQDTVFLVVADHDSRVFGSNLIPVEKFRIPGLILGADIKPAVITPLASQIDLPTTLLSIAGISSCHPMDGRDFMLDATSPGRALLQFDNQFALMEENSITLLRPDSTALEGNYDNTTQRLTLSSATVPDQMAQKALAHAHLPSFLYREQRYSAEGGCDQSGQVASAVQDRDATL
jgi:phosphoglycerol transferase MdoB-like AlkP superfamily enzyme